MHSLRTRIVLLTLLITVLAVVVVTLTSVLFIQNQEHEESRQMLLLLCQTGVRNLDYYFTSVEKSVLDVAGFTEGNFPGLDDETALREHTRQVEEYFDIAANKTNGVLTYYYRLDPEKCGNVKGFWYTNLDKKKFVPHEVTDITLYDQEDTGSLVWFTVPKRENRAIWLPPYITDNLDKRVISYNLPIHYYGAFVGVVGIEIDYSIMKDQVESIRLSDNGYAFLTNAQGELICHPHLDVALLSEKNELPETPEGLLSDSSFSTYTFEGQKKEAIWLKLSNGMRLYVSMPVAEAKGEWLGMIRYVLFAAMAVVVAAVLLTLFFTGRITRPLKQLTEAAKRTDEGNYDFTLEYRGKDEVGTLTNTFKRLADHMKSQISDLNKRANVDALTSVRNKGAFDTYIGNMQSTFDAGNEKPEFAIGIFDCDDLKQVNDEYGHDKGDVYLKTASRLICKVFQHSPLFRIGGDEFAVILRNDDFRYREDLVASFEKATAGINTTAENPWEQVSVSMGMAVYDPAQDHSVNDTMRRADRTMYINKRNRKGTNPEQ